MLSIYNLVTTWLEGVPYLVPACVLNLTTVSVLHPKGNVKLLLSLPQYYVMLYVVDVSKNSIGTLLNVFLCVDSVFTVHITGCVLRILLYMYGCALLDYDTEVRTHPLQRLFTYVCMRINAVYLKRSLEMVWFLILLLPR